MNKIQAEKLADAVMRSRNFCESKRSQIFCVIRNKDNWELKELNELIFGKNKQYKNFINGFINENNR